MGAAAPFIPLIVASTGLGIMEGKSAQRKQERAIKQQQALEREQMARAEKLAREQMAVQEKLASQSAALYEQAINQNAQAINRANPRRPTDAAGSLDRETQAGRGGPASTMLTGAGGVDPELLNLGRRSLLGT